MLTWRGVRTVVGDLGRPVAWCLVPWVLAATFRGVAPWLPDGSIPAQVAQATLLSASRWVLLFGAAWALRVGLRYRRWGVALGFAVAGFLAAGVPPALLRLAEASPGSARADPAIPATRVVVANVNAYTDPPEPERLARAIAALDPDVAVLVERRAEAIPGMRRVADDFDEPMPRPSHASAVFCRGPCEAAITEPFGSDSQTMPVALVRVGRTCLLGLHAPPPVPLDPTGILPHVRRVAAALADGRLARDWGPCRVGDGAVVAGDLNHVPGSRPYRMLRARGLRDLLAPRGVWASSWPAGGGWPDLPFLQLDQLLVGRAAVGAVRQVRVPGSDHIGLVFEVHDG